MLTYAICWRRLNDAASGWWMSESVYDDAQWPLLDLGKALSSTYYFQGDSCRSVRQGWSASSVCAVAFIFHAFSTGVSAFPPMDNFWVWPQDQFWELLKAIAILLSRWFIQQLLLLNINSSLTVQSFPCIWFYVLLFILIDFLSVQSLFP